MRSNGLATIMLIIPVLTVPALAVFGIPQFTAVVASPLDDDSRANRESRNVNFDGRAGDELFDDSDRFESERDSGSAPLSKRRGSQRSSQNRQQESQSVAWGDDLDDDPSTSIQPRGRASQDTSLQRTQDQSLGYGNSKKSHKAKAGKTDRLRPIDDLDRGSLQSDFDDDPVPGRNSTSANHQIRPRLKVPSNDKRGTHSSESLTWKNAVNRLDELEIRNFRLEPGEQRGHFVFICSYTPPDSPAVSYRFEASAEEPLKAVEKVIEQINEWRQSR